MVRSLKRDTNAQSEDRDGGQLFSKTEETGRKAKRKKEDRFDFFEIYHPERGRVFIKDFSFSFSLAEVRFSKVALKTAGKIKGFNPEGCLQATGRKEL